MRSMLKMLQKRIQVAIIFSDKMDVPGLEDKLTPHKTAFQKSLYGKAWMPNDVTFRQRAPESLLIMALLSIIL